MADPAADPGRFPEAAAAFRKRIPMKRGAWERLSAAAKERAFFVSEVALASLVAEVHESLSRAIRDGTPLEEWKREIGAKLRRHWGGDKPGRLETIFRTNVLTAYNAGRAEIFDEPAVKRTRPYWRFDDVDDDRQTEICSDHHRVILPAIDPFWNDHYPPLHFQCRSSITALSEREAALEGVTVRRPTQAAQEGFGRKPTTSGQDVPIPKVQIDPGALPAEIGQELLERLDEWEMDDRKKAAG